MQNVADLIDFMRAIQTNNQQRFFELIASDPRLALGDCTNNPLQQAIKHSTPKVVGALLQAGANPNAASYCGTPLFHAVQRGDVQIVQSLLEHKANPNLAEDGFDTPLTVAMRRNNVAMIELLLKYNAEAIHGSGVISDPTVTMRITTPANESGDAVNLGGSAPQEASDI